MRMIDADALSAKMYHDAFETDSDMQKWDSGCWISYKMFKKNLEDTPTIAQPEQKKGEWNFIGDNMFKCTCCGVLYTTYQLNGLRNYDTDPYAPYFCPNCGANMRD